jgi:hypothetical protein
MNRSMLTVILLVSLSFAAAAQPKTWRGTWSATVGNGGTVFGGTWDASESDKPDTGLGSWTVKDQEGADVAAGTWAARKDAKIWRGNWQARTPSGRVYSGTWRAQSHLPSSSSFSQLLESAMSKMASGTWRMAAAYAGRWSIVAYPAQ